jgi:hypothetical protein
VLLRGIQGKSRTVLRYDPTLPQRSIPIDSRLFKTFQAIDFQHFRARNFIAVERAVLYERYATIEMKYSKIRD